MNKHQIRLSSRDSLLSTNRDNFADLKLEQSTKLFPFPDVKETIDQYEVFEKERSECNKYRLILTINPFCTNILFNPLTEIIKNEGSDNPIVVDDFEKAKAQDTDGAKGVETPTRNQMIMNTEYSKDTIGFEYHPGYDMFTNHILRNLTFKMVNTESNNVSINPDKWNDFVNETFNSSKDVFNTIGDFMRYADGEIIQYRKRTSIDKQNNELTKDLNKHLYLADDLLSFEDSINGNLTEENGWFGFVNNSSILSKERSGKKDDNNNDIWLDMDMCRVLNNRKSCEFIDMYPDRTLFSFNPKYNKFKHRPEYNWNICITYPYKNDYNHPIVTSGDGTNALKIYSIEKTIGTDGADVLLVQTFTKHGLKRGDNIFFYYSNDNDNSYIKCEKSVKITNIGDLNRNNDDYFFYTTDMSLLDYTDVVLEGENKTLFRFRKFVNGLESEYYIRIFKKLPNLKWRKENLTEDIANDKEKYEEYLNKNAKIDEKMIDFDKEQYQLAFASTIYNDNSTQITFTDSLDISNIVDNWGRPLTELYLTFVKNNKGYKEWYNGERKTTKDVDIEYSHCFGKVTSGLMFYNGDGFFDEKKGLMSDVRMINNLGWHNSQSLEAYLTDNLKEEITIDNETFAGDLVEFNANEVMENVLDDVYFRFNTAQRETIANERYKLFQYQEITSDDYDLDNFTVTNYNADDINGTSTVLRPEGYYYKAHYKIDVREFGSINQLAHYDLKVKQAVPTQNGGIYIKVTSSLAHGLSVDDIVFVCEKDKWYETSVAYVIDKNNFIMNNVTTVDENENEKIEINWIKLCDGLNDGTYKIRKKNKEIPNYAVKVGENKFLWRNVLRVGDKDATNLPEYVFSNGHFYINKVVNFFLKRQDPDGKSGLYSKNIFPNDVYGNIKTESNYEYKDVSEAIC